MPESDAKVCTDDFSTKSDLEIDQISSIIELCTQLTSQPDFISSGSKILNQYIQEFDNFQTSILFPNVNFQTSIVSEYSIVFVDPNFKDTCLDVSNGLNTSLNSLFYVVDGEVIYVYDRDISRYKSRLSRYKSRHFEAEYYVLCVDPNPLITVDSIVIVI